MLLEPNLSTILLNHYIDIVRTSVIVTNVVVTKVAAPSEVTLMRRLKLGKIPMLGKKEKNRLR
jgi:hypothetical protein